MVGALCHSPMPTVRPWGSAASPRAACTHQVCCAHGADAKEKFMEELRSRLPQ